MNGKVKVLNRDRIEELYWKKKYNIREVANSLGVSFWSVYNFMNKYKIARRGRSEVNYVVNKYRPQFMLKNNLSFDEESIKIAGVMLYWAEGTLKGNTVDFANSNAEMVRFFLRFLREVCGIKEKRLRIYLYAYPYQNIETLKLYWYRVTGIPLRQFTKPYIRKSTPNLSNRKLPYGTIHIRYNDKRLLELIKSWIGEYIKYWAGTQAAKGDRLYQSSVLPKGGMEK